ncbi:phosphatidylglycerophosphatase A family protein [Suttonella ornithocola]|uniref:Phosphatidylglycerophosphatase A n=1 Tax=Suttonella ornithocola TaxID=279832 RepID=A0A380MUN0_9GAMM|nr:phosphatidylglycerophosphatase A [Suttonella ornithocola]SUO95623.1 Phosphatidylglycerophosphatase A [Suttonella ornithocola]
MTKKHPHTFKTLIRNPIHFFAFGLGSGLITPAPGTWGSVAGVLILLPFWKLLLASPIIAWLLLIVAFLLGCWLCDKTEKDIGTHDLSNIVWDEFIGVWLVMLALPTTLIAHWGMLLTAFCAFISFRIFDILKPPPIKQLDRYAPGGFGVMIDDIAAAGFALIPLWVIPWILDYF